MSWDDETTTTGSLYTCDSTTSNVITGGNSGRISGGFQVNYYTSGNSSAITGTAFAGPGIQYVWTNYTPTTGIFSGANTCGGNGHYGSSIPVFDPAQVEALRRDFKDVKESRKRKKAELRARRLFKRVVGDIAYEKFKQRGYHEIRGASGERYRLEPGRWIQVMKGCADKVDYELCAHLEVGIPWFDTMAVQHLMLTTSKETEEQFRKIANRHQVGYYPLEELRHRAG